MKKSKKIIRTLLIPPLVPLHINLDVGRRRLNSVTKANRLRQNLCITALVWGLFFSWFLTKPNPLLAQTASLVATVRINPLEVEVAAPHLVSVGKRFKVKAIVKNSGETKIKKTKVEIFLSPGLSLKGSSERKLGAISERDSKSAFWWVTAEEAGNHVISVGASGIEEETGGLVEASGSSATVMIEVQNSKGFWSLIRKIFDV